MSELKGRYQHRKSQEIFKFIRAQADGKVVFLDGFGGEVVFSASTVKRWMKSVSDIPIQLAEDDEEQLSLLKPSNTPTPPRHPVVLNVPKGKIVDPELDKREQAIMLAVLFDATYTEGYESEISLDNLMLTIIDLVHINTQIAQFKLETLQDRGFIVLSPKYKTVELTQKAISYYIKLSLVSDPNGVPTKREKLFNLKKLNRLVEKAKKTVGEKPERKKSQEIKTSIVSGLSHNKDKSFDPKSLNPDEVILLTFTGMAIGVFKIEKKTSKSIQITTKKGVQKFDAKTLKQINMPNPNYAGRLILSTKEVK